MNLISIGGMIFWSVVGGVISVICCEIIEYSYNKLIKNAKSKGK